MVMHSVIVQSEFCLQQEIGLQWQGVAFLKWWISRFGIKLNLVRSSTTNTQRGNLEYSISEYLSRGPVDACSMRMAQKDEADMEEGGYFEGY